MKKRHHKSRFKRYRWLIIPFSLFLMICSFIILNNLFNIITPVILEKEANYPNLAANQTSYNPIKAEKTVLPAPLNDATAEQSMAIEGGAGGGAAAGGGSTTKKTETFNPTNDTDNIFRQFAPGVGCCNSSSLCIINVNHSTCQNVYNGTFYYDAIYNMGCSGSVCVTVPEFTMAGACLAVLGAGMGYWLIRRKLKK